MSAIRVSRFRLLRVGGCLGVAVAVVVTGAAQLPGRVVRAVAAPAAGIKGPGPSESSGRIPPQSAASSVPAREAPYVGAPGVFDCSIISLEEIAQLQQQGSSCIDGTDPGPDGTGPDDPPGDYVEFQEGVFSGNAPSGPAPSPAPGLAGSAGNICGSDTPPPTVDVVMPGHSLGEPRCQEE